MPAFRLPTTRLWIFVRWGFGFVCLYAGMKFRSLPRFLVITVEESKLFFSASFLDPCSYIFPSCGLYLYVTIIVRLFSHSIPLHPTPCHLLLSYPFVSFCSLTLGALRECLIFHTCTSIYAKFLQLDVGCGKCSSHNLITGFSTPFISGSTSPHITSSTISFSCPASTFTHLPPGSASPAPDPISFPILSNTPLTLLCISSFSYLSSPYPPLSLAFSGSISRKIVRSGAGRPISGERHHSYVRPAVTLDAENATPEKA
jgi:hypothetical protein